MKNNKVCIVTGASRGLGRGIALVLAQEEGCTVYATARNEEALKALAEEAAAGTKGGVVKVCTLDQRDDAAVQDFVEQVKSEENQVDLLVNSAYAGLIGRPLPRPGPDAHDDGERVHLSGGRRQGQPGRLVRRRGHDGRGTGPGHRLGDPLQPLPRARIARDRRRGA